MQNKYTAYISVLILLVFIFYIVFDTIAPAPIPITDNKKTDNKFPEDKWMISNSINSDLWTFKVSNSLW